MTYNIFKNVPFDYLLHSLAQCTKEYRDAVTKKEDEIKIEIRKEEVHLFQKIIVAKRLEFPPG
jgi:hypothetical protein